jgi:AcrR family transcriptional regulator
MRSGDLERDQPRRLRADAERNRARLLDAARAAFASGQEQVTLEQIAKDADVGIGTLYRHFPTREALVEALYRKELADLCASADDLLAAYAPDQALRAWMDRFSDYVTAKREMADTLRAVVAAGNVTVSQIREQLAEAVRKMLDAGVAAGSLRDDVRAEDIVATVVGMFTATSFAGGNEQLQRMLNLLMDAVRRPQRTSPTPTATPSLPVDPGLCGACEYASVKDTRRGTTYLRCTRASWDSRLVKYPRLPVTTCVGFARPEPESV